MDLLLILTYAAICYAIFKIFKIPVNKWTVPTALLGGVVLIAGLILIMSYNHPFTTDARIYFTTTPIVTSVQGRVVEVPVAANSALKKDAVLFRIDPRPFEYAVDGKKAALAEAQHQVRELEAAYAAAVSGVDEAIAARDRAKQAFDRSNQANETARTAGRPLPFAEIAVENQRGVFLAAEAAVTTAEARAEQARIAYEAEVGGTNPTVARLQSELKNAEYELEQTTVRAPADGYVTHLSLRPGAMAVPFPLRPVMVFVNSEDMTLAAAFVENSLQRVLTGDEAEIAFKAVPGAIFRGRVKNLVNVMAQGEIQPTGALIDPSAPERRRQALAIATIEILDDTSKYQLPGGISAEVAIYTKHFHHVGILRRVLLRMSSWMNFVFLVH